MPYDIKICLFLLYKDLCCPINSIYRKIRANHTDFPVIDFFYLDSSEKVKQNLTNKKKLLDVYKRQQRSFNIS